MGLNGNCDFPTEFHKESDDCVDGVAPFVAPSTSDSMLQAVIDAWEQMTDAEKSLCFSMARQATGKPLFASNASETTRALSGNPLRCPLRWRASAAILVAGPSKS